MSHSLGLPEWQRIAMNEYRCGELGVLPSVASSALALRLWERGTHRVCGSGSLHAIGLPFPEAEALAGLCDHLNVAVRGPALLAIQSELLNHRRISHREQHSRVLAIRIRVGMPSPCR